MKQPCISNQVLDNVRTILDRKFGFFQERIMAQGIQMGPPSVIENRKGELVCEALAQDDQIVNEKIQREKKALELIKRLEDIGQNERVYEYDLTTEEGLASLKEYIDAYETSQREQAQLQKIKESNLRVRSMKDEVKRKKEAYQQEEFERLERERREKEDNEAARLARIEDDIRAKEARREQEKEQKRIDDEQFQEQLMKQKVHMYMTIEKKQQNFDPEKSDWKKLYEDYLDNEKKKEQRQIERVMQIEEEYRANLDKLAKERKERDYMHKGFSDDSYYEELKKRRDLEEKQKKAKRAMEMEQRVNYEETIEKSKAYVDFSKKFYDMRHPKELLKAHQKEKKEKINELIEKWKEERPVKFDEKKKEEREKLQEKLSNRENMREIIEEKRREAQEKMPNYLEQLKQSHKDMPTIVNPKKGRISAQSSVKSISETKTQGNPPNDVSETPIRRKLSNNTYTRSIPAIKRSHAGSKLLGRKDDEDWEKALQKETGSKMEVFEKVLQESERLAEKAKRKEFLEKVSAQAKDEKTGQKLEQPFEKYESTADQMYMGSIRAKLALLNELH